MNRNKLNFLRIKDGYTTTSGASQYWYKQRFAAVSGCGPTTASEILAYLAREHTDTCATLYPYNAQNIEREKFVDFMTDVRSYVKPGIMGLTDIDFYTDQTLSFANTKGVSLNAKQTNKHLSVTKAFSEVVVTIDKGLPLAMLILTNPNDDVKNFTWHWMNIIGYDKDRMMIIVSSYGKEHMLDFKHVWVNKDSYKTELVHFWPKEA